MSELFAGKYELLTRVGKGAMGEVWLAEERGPRNFRRYVAVKMLHAAGDVGEMAMDSFVAEAQVIARLDHPNIVRLIELGGGDAGELYLVLEFLDGCSLHSLLRNTGAMSPAAVAFLGRDVARALAAVHSMQDDSGNNYGVVHRDVSPSNILLALDGRVKLTDFGIARISGLGGERTETGVFKGKLAYMPPEQAAGSAFDGRADVFALGVTLLESLLGARLRKAETQAQYFAMVTSEPVPLTHDVAPDAPAALAAAIDRATAFDAKERTASAETFARELEDALWELGPRGEREAVAEIAERVRTTTGGSLSQSVPAAVHAQNQKPAPWSVSMDSGAGGASSSGSFVGSSSAVGAASAPGSQPSDSGALAGGAAGFQAGSPYSHPGMHGQALQAGSAPGTLTSVATASEMMPVRRGSQTKIWLVLTPLAVLVGVGGGALYFSLNPPGGESVAALDGNAAGGDASTAATDSDTDEDGAATATSTGSDPAPEATGTEAAETDTVGTDTGTEEGPDSAPTTPPIGPRPPSPVPPSPPSDGSEDSTEPGTLQVVAIPWGNVTVDGKSVGQTPIAPVSLPPGPHSVVVSNPELGATRSYSVNIKPGQPSLLKVDLKSAN